MSKLYIVYHSETGRTHQLAKLLAEGAAAVKGTRVELVSAEEVDYAQAARSDSYAIGSPNYFNYVAGTVKTFFDRILYDDRFKGKPYAAFGTDAGGGHVLGCIDSLARSCGLKQAAPGIAASIQLGPQEAAKARDLGKALAQACKRDR